MVFNINEFTPDVQLPNYKQTDYGLSMEMAILGKKNQEQAKALETINTLQNKSINISMLNIEGKGRLDKLNQELNESLSGDLGDLTKITNQNKIADLFQKISTDKELIKASQMSKQYQKEFDSVQMLKNSGRKDSGYNEVNEFVWMNWDGGYYDFMKKGLSEVSDPNFRQAKYTPYKDLKIPLANLTKLLHEDSVGRESQTLDDKGSPTGYLTKRMYSGVSPERVKALYDEQFGQDDIAQLEVLSKYEILKAGDKSYLYDQYKSFSDNEDRAEKARQSELNQRILYNNEKLKGKLSDEERQTLEAENLAYQNNVQIVTANLEGRRGVEKSKEDFTKMSNDELLGYVYQIKKQEKIKDAVNAFSWKKDIQELGADTTYLAQKKIDAMMAQTKIREEGANNRVVLNHKLRMEEKNASKSGKGPDEDPSGWALVADISKNEQDILSGYDRLVNLQDQYSKQSDNIIASPSLDNNTIRAENWRNFYEKNKGNYYADMWDVFQTNKNLAYDSNGNPNKEAFRLWEIDQRANPSTLTQGIIKNHADNQYTAEYLTEELGKINGALRASAQSTKNILSYARTTDGQQLSEADFYSGKEIFINVPTSPKINGQPYTGNYQKKPLKDLLYDLKNEKNIAAKNSSQIKGAEGKSPYYFEGPNAPTVTTTYLDNDPGLKQALQMYADAEQDPTVKKVLTEKLPQYRQFGYAQTSEPDLIAPYQGQISAAAKMGSDEFRTLFGVGAIEAIALPQGAGNKGIVKFKHTYAEQLKEAKIMMPTESGNVMEVVVPGRGYLFDTQAVGGRNVMMNNANLYKPYVASMDGYKYEIIPTAGGSKVIRITKPDGTVLPDTFGGTEKTDVAEIISNIQKFIKADATRKP